MLLIHVVYLGSVYKNLKHFETLHASQFSHNIVKRGVQHSDHPFNRIREVTFSTLGRYLQLNLRVGMMFDLKLF